MAIRQPVVPVMVRHSVPVVPNSKAVTVKDILPVRPVNNRVQVVPEVLEVPEIIRTM